MLAMAMPLAFLPAVTPSVLAEALTDKTTTDKDVLVAVRTLAFVVHPPAGAVPLAVVFDPAAPQSLAELQTVIGVLDDGTRVGAMTVHPVPVAITDLDQLSNYRFVLLIAGVQSYRQAIFDRTRGQGIVTISADLDCVRAGLCVMGVAAQPRVQVLVNRTAAAAAAVEFLLAFRMMITEM